MTQEQNDSVRVSPSHISTMNNFNSVFTILRGPGSVVGIATGYGLDSLGFDSQWG